MFSLPPYDKASFHKNISQMYPFTTPHPPGFHHPHFLIICPSQDLTLLVPETKIAEFQNSVDLGEVAHNDPPHLDLHCLSSSL